MVRVGPRQPKPANRPAKKEAGIQRDIETLVESLTGISATTILTPDHRGFVVSDGSISIREMKGFPALEIREKSRIRPGASGVVIECWHRDLPDRKYALKLLRPSTLQRFLKLGQLEEAARQQELARIEGVNTAVLSHQNLIYLAGVSTVDVRVGGLSYLVNASLLEWIEGAQSLSTGIYEHCQDSSDLVGIMIQVMRGLEHMHSKKLIHWDIKSDNCLLTPESVVKITDIGNARPCQDPGSLNAIDGLAHTSKENCPPWLMDGLPLIPADSNRVEISLTKGEITIDRPWFDLYCAGRMFQRILGFEDELGEQRRDERGVFLARVFIGSEEAVFFEAVLVPDCTASDERRQFGYHP